MFYTFVTINNLEPEKCYVGMSMKPKESGYKGSGIYFKKALSKYGRKNFTRVDLAKTEYIDEAHYWEGFYIKTLKTLSSEGGYNISPKGGLGVSGCHSEETLTKISVSMTGEKHPLFGTHMSEETKQKSREAQLGNKNLTYPKNRKSSAGKIVRLKPIWNKGLTKESDDRVKRYSHPKNQNKK